MLLMPQRKKLALLIAGQLPKAPYVQGMGEDSAPADLDMPEEEVDPMEGLTASMDAFMSALDQKDARGMATALQDFLVMCEPAAPLEEAE